MQIQSVRDLDKETWRKYVAFCKLKNVKVGSELSKILDDHLKEHFKKLFENEKTK